VEHVDELIAAHALRALDPGDERIVEEHLAECERCRVELRQFEAVASGLAYTAPPTALPPHLRARILGSVEPVVPAAHAPSPDARRRFAWWPRVATVAAPALAVAVLALLAWNISLRDQLSGRDVSAVGQIASVGNVVRYGDGDVRLFATLPPAATGKIYEAWVIRDGTPLPAGTFRDGSGEIDLTRPAQPGDVIAVTLEPGNGSETPTGDLLGKTTLGTA
jgi:anti-sigma-K factor RskA/putative zinc finger protein